MEVDIRPTSGPVVERPGDLAALLTNLETGDILFIDEIHRLNHVVEEILYPAMEDFQVDVMIGQGPGAKSIKLDLKRFTLIGATTRSGLLTPALRNRFGAVFRLDFYEPQVLAKLLARSASLLGVGGDDAGFMEIARRSRGTPRIANRLLRRVRDYAEVHGEGRITRPVTCLALEMLEVDELGCDKMDTLLLTAIIDKFDGGPVGLDTLAAAIGEERGTVEDAYEPYLIQAGFLERRPQGRVATPVAYRHLGRSQSASRVDREKRQKRLL